MLTAVTDRPAVLSYFLSAPPADRAQLRRILRSESPEWGVRRPPTVSQRDGQHAQDTSWSTVIIMRGLAEGIPLKFTSGLAVQNRSVGVKQMRRLKALAVAPMISAFVGLVPGATAQQTKGCPPRIGEESHLRLARGTSIRWYNNLIHWVDFKGNIEILLAPDPNDAQSAHVGVLSFHEEGKTEFNRFTLELSQRDIAPRSTLRCTETQPPKMTLTYMLNLALTARSVDGEEGQVHTKNPVVQSVELNQWPPNGEVFELERPIEFVFPDDPDEIIATIEKYPTQERGALTG